jgi:hypothetical protein
MKSGFPLVPRAILTNSKEYMHNEGRSLLFVCKLADVSNERDSDIDMSAGQQLKKSDLSLRNVPVMEKLT